MDDTLPAEDDPAEDRVVLRDWTCVAEPDSRPDDVAGALRTFTDWSVDLLVATRP